MKETGDGFLDWDKHADESVSGGSISDLTMAPWGDKLITFHKNPPSNGKIHQRAYHLDDKGELVQEDWWEVHDENDAAIHNAGHYIKSVVFKGKMYLFYLSQENKKFHLRYIVSDDQDLRYSGKDRRMRFTSAGYVKAGERKISLDNNYLDTWDVAAWSGYDTDPSLPESRPTETLVVARIHENKLHIYSWDGNPDSRWNYLCKEGYPSECYSMKMVQGAVNWNNWNWTAENDNPLTILFSERHKGIRATQYTPFGAKSGTFAETSYYTGLDEAWFGATPTSSTTGLPQNRFTEIISIS